MENILVGEVIKNLRISEDKMALLFVTDNGNIEVLCDAECCSETWVEHIEMPALGLPAKVIEATDLEMPNLGDMEGRDVVEYYGFKIVTDKGEIIIDYRNDSNGYYGGMLAWPSDMHYGGVYNKNISTKEWVDVKSDQ